MDKVLSEKRGSRNFKQVSRWNGLDFTIVSRNSKFAQYTDNYLSKADRLNLTCFHFGSIVLPLRRFGKLDKPIELKDLVTLTRFDPETNLFLEINGDKSKVRLYREVTVGGT